MPKLSITNVHFVATEPFLLAKPLSNEDDLADNAKAEGTVIETK